MVLGFFEIPEDEQPPENIWGDDERLIAWFGEVRSRSQSADKGMEPVPEPTRNALVDDLGL